MKPDTNIDLTTLLDKIAGQAAQADRSRTLDRDLVALIKQDPVSRLTACKVVGGVEASIQSCGEALESIASKCTSTAWVLMNHLGQTHLITALLGDEHPSLLRQLVEERNLVCFPVGAGTSVEAARSGTTICLRGKSEFGSGARYADKAGVIFVLPGEDKARFALVDLHHKGVEIEDSWRAMSLRASSTDTLHYNDVEIVDSASVPFPRMYREVFRRPSYPVISPRYREDWMAISNIWLGYMGIGLVQSCLDDVVENIRDRIAFMGVRVAERANVHMNIGHAQANISAARDSVRSVCAETDGRIDSSIPPTESDYFRQMGAAVSALRLCDEALSLLVRVMGANGLREGPAFERRWRDFQAIPIHLNTHPDRVSEIMGRHILGLTMEQTF